MIAALALSLVSFLAPSASDGIWITADIGSMSGAGPLPADIVWFNHGAPAAPAPAPVVIGPAPVVSAPAPSVCHEDMACWDWRTMGNGCRGIGPMGADGRPFALECWTEGRSVIRGQ